MVCGLRGEAAGAGRKKLDCEWERVGGDGGYTIVIFFLILMFWEVIR